MKVPVRIYQLALFGYLREDTLGGVLTVVELDCCTEEELPFSADSTGAVSGADTLGTLFQSTYNNIWVGNRDQRSDRRLCLWTRHLLLPPLPHMVLVSPPDMTILQQDTIRHWNGSSHNHSWQPLLSRPKVSHIDCLIILKTSRSSSTIMIHFLLQLSVFYLISKIRFQKIKTCPWASAQQQLCWGHTCRTLGSDSV